jgi:hypothetical protein
MHLGEIARQEKPQQSIALITQGRQMFRELKDSPDARSAGRALWRAQFDQYVQMMKEWNSLPDVYGNPWLLFCKVLSYVIFCFLLRELALIRGRGDADLAWIPLVQWGLLCDMAGLPWILMFLTGVFFISGIGFFLFMLVKIYFLLALLIALRQPLWPLIFPLTGFPLLDLFYWIFLVIERKHETYHTTSDS